MRHRRRTGRPGFRPDVAATTLVIVCAATVHMASSHGPDIDHADRSRHGAHGTVGRSPPRRGCQRTRFGLRSLGRSPLAPDDSATLSSSRGASRCGMDPVDRCHRRDLDPRLPVRPASRSSPTRPGRVCGKPRHGKPGQRATLSGRRSAPLRSAPRRSAPLRSAPRRSGRQKAARRRAERRAEKRAAERRAGERAAQEAARAARRRARSGDPAGATRTS